jgi:hypothetical protein
MTNQILASEPNQMTGMLGLFLMLVVARLANLGYSAQPATGETNDLLRPSGGFPGFLARRGIDGVAAFGWIADHLPMSARARA